MARSDSGARADAYTGVTALSIESDGTDSYLTFTFLVLSILEDGKDLQYTVGVSDDLANWDWSGNEIDYVSSVLMDDGVTYQLKARLTTPVQALSKQKFLKLRVTYRPKTFSDWQSFFFTPAERADTNTTSGRNADPDHDGIPNVLEYAFGSSPKQANASVLPQTFISQVGNNSYLNLKYRRKFKLGFSSDDQDFAVGVSDDLTLWDWTGTQIQNVLWDQASDGSAWEVTVRLATPINLLQHPKFLKLKVTTLP